MSLVVGSLEYFTPNIDIWALFDPKKRENSTQATSNQKHLTETKTYLVFSGTALLKDNFYKGDNGSPTGVDRRHDGPSHWLFHPQRCWDLVLSSQVSLTFPPWQLLFLSTTFSSAGSSCQLSSHGLMCSLLSRGDFQMMWRGRIRSRISQNWHSTVPYCYLFAHILESRVDS